jgi:hypothetical protein
MGLTLVTVWGGTSSNSYVDASYVESYAEEKPFVGTNWINDSDDDLKKACILQATKDIDTYPWITYKMYFDQALAFPRSLTVIQRYYLENDSLLTQIEYTEMQTQVKKACAEQALYIYDKDGIMENVRMYDEGQAGKSETIGRLSESYSISRTPHLLCYEARTMLRSYKGAPRLVRG